MMRRAAQLLLCIFSARVAAETPGHLRGARAQDATCPDKCDGVIRCFYDPTCSEPGAPQGCNAGGKGQNCRFCGNGGGDIECPSPAPPATCPEKCDGVTRCFYDPTCSEPGAPQGCNAGGKGQNCRFCGNRGGDIECPSPAPNATMQHQRLQAGDGCPYFDGFDVQGKVCPWEYGGDYKGTASCGGSISEGWTCSLWHGIPTGSGVDLQAYVDSVHGAGYCAKNPSGDPCVGWGIYGPGCTC